jgi:hypothetical protein
MVGVVPLPPMDTPCQAALGTPKPGEVAKASVQENEGALDSEVALGIPQMFKEPFSIAHVDPQPLPNKPVDPQPVADVPEMFQSPPGAAHGTPERSEKRYLFTLCDDEPTSTKKAAKLSDVDTCQATPARGKCRKEVLAAANPPSEKMCCEAGQIYITRGKDPPKTYIQVKIDGKLKHYATVDEKNHAEHEAIILHIAKDLEAKNLTKVQCDEMKKKLVNSWPKVS